MLLFAGWMLVILLGTLGRRGGACPAPILTPFHSYYAALAPVSYTHLRAHET